MPENRNLGMNIAAIYSGGKDGHLAMLKMVNAGHRISCIITLDGGDGHSFFFHDLRKTEIVQSHAERMGIPIVIVPLEDWMRQGSAGTGDILRHLANAAAAKYEFDALCSGATDGDDEGNSEGFRAAGKSIGLHIETPLAGLDAAAILRQQEEAGIRAIIVATEKGKLPESVLGMEAGSRFAAILEKLNKKGIYADGNDFQTLVIDSPLFSSPIEIRSSEIIRDRERAYLKITEFE